MSAPSVNLIEAHNLCRTIGRDFENSDVTEALTKAAVEFVDSYTGTNTFIPKVRGKSMTAGRARAVLNVMRQELLGIDPPWKRRKSETSSTPAAGKKFACYWRGCDESFDSMPEVLAHKKTHRSSAAPPASAPAPAPAPRRARYSCYTCGQEFGDDREAWEKLADHRHLKHGGPPRLGSPVLPIRGSWLNLDLSGLPDGNYAFPNPDKTSSHDHLYFQVKRARKRAWRDRLFVWGHRIRGGEWVEAGTIEVREWSSDTKRLFGEQKPLDVYRGEYEEILVEIMKDPEDHARLFGRKIGRCGVCGKTLTDDTSLAEGIGPECRRKPRYFYERPPSYRMQTSCTECGGDGKIVYVHRAKHDNRVTFECPSGHEWDARMDKTTKELVS
jgi:hypothetical protein